MAAYEEGLNEEPIQPGASRTRQGTMNSLIVSYYSSAAFQGLADQTRKTYRGIIERFRQEHGDKSMTGLRPQHIRALIEQKAQTPSAANNLLMILRILLGHAVDIGLRDENPAVGVRNIRAASQGFRTWQEADIQHFEARWPVGTAQRLAFDLCLYTGQRRSDVVRMGPQHVRDGVLSIRQQKTGTEVVIPVHGNLLASLDTAQTGEMVFLLTSQGRAFTANGFGNFFRDAVESAGLRGLSAHGLRKAACRRLAEAGCSAHEIMSISGHVSLREVQRYTMAANREQMARSAFQKLGTSQNKNSQT